MERMAEGRGTDLFEDNYFKEMCSGFEAGSYLRRIDFVSHSRLESNEEEEKQRPGDSFALLDVASR